MRNFYYYQGNWKDGFKHLITICMKSLTEADVEFEALFQLDPRNIKSGIVVMLEPKD